MSKYNLLKCQNTILFEKGNFKVFKGILPKTTKKTHHRQQRVYGQVFLSVSKFPVNNLFFVFLV